MPDLSILKVVDKTDSYYTAVPNLFDLSFRLLIVGKSFLSGKSTVILNLLLRDRYYKKHFDGNDIYIVSNNLSMDNKMRILRTEKSVPDANVMEFTEQNLENIYTKVEEEAEDAVNDNEKPKNVVVILDDCAYSGDLKKSVNGTLSRMLCNGRHINLSLIITAQKHTLLSTVARSNASGAILFSNSQRELDAISDDFNYLDSKKDFVKMFRKVTKERNSFLCVNFSSPDLYQDSNFEPIKMEV